MTTPSIDAVAAIQAAAGPPPARSVRPPEPFRDHLRLQPVDEEPAGGGEGPPQDEAALSSLPPAPRAHDAADASESPIEHSMGESHGEDDEGQQSAETAPPGGPRNAVAEVEGTRAEPFVDDSGRPEISAESSGAEANDEDAGGEASGPDGQTSEENAARHPQAEPTAPTAKSLAGEATPELPRPASTAPAGEASAASDIAAAAGERLVEPLSTGEAAPAAAPAGEDAANPSATDAPAAKSADPASPRQGPAANPIDPSAAALAQPEPRPDKPPASGDRGRPPARREVPSPASGNQASRAISDRALHAPAGAEVESAPLLSGNSTAAADAPPVSEAPPEPAAAPRSAGETANGLPAQGATASGERGAAIQERHRAPAPQGGRALTEAQHARLVQRVAKAFDIAHSRGESTIRLRLSPPELGSLRLEVQVESGALTARLEVETQAARDALIDNLSALRQRLSEQNIRVEHFDVDLMDRQQDGAAQQRGGRSSPRDEDRQDLPIRPANVGSAAAGDNERRGAVGKSLLDTNIDVLI